MLKVVNFPNPSTRVEKVVRERLEALLKDNEGNVAGFAIVVWTPTGVCQAGIMADRGIVSEQFIPTMVSHHLNRLLVVGEHVEDTGS